MSFTIIQMQSDAGTLNAAILPPQHAFARATNLAPDWNSVRIALLFSFRGLSSESAAPTAEWLGPDGGQPMKIHIGLSDGTGHPGSAGARFIGWSNHQPYGLGLYQYSGVWWFNYNSTIAKSRFSPLATDGTNIITNRQVAADINCGAATPTGATGHAFSVIMELYRYGNGALTTYINGLSSVTIHNQQHVGILLASLLSSATTTTGTIASGGWWSPEIPTDCTHLYVHFPWAANRLVLHGMQVVRLS